MVRSLLFLICICLAFVSCIEENETSNDSKDYDLTAKVIYLKDGDSFVVLDEDKEEVEVRMIDIDAPELYQAHGKKAKQFLSKMIKGKRVGLDYDHKDKFGRILARAYLDTIDLNYAMVAAGYAWQYRHSKDQDLADAEDNAHDEKKGLWQDKNPEEPWKWRKNNSRR